MKVNSTGCSNSPNEFYNIAEKELSLIISASLITDTTIFRKRLFDELFGRVCVGIKKIGFQRNALKPLPVLSDPGWTILKPIPGRIEGYVSNIPTFTKRLPLGFCIIVNRLL